MVESASGLNLRKLQPDEDRSFISFEKGDSFSQGKASFALPESDLVIMKVSQFPPWKSVSDSLRSISSAFWRPVSLLVRCICGRVARPRPRPPELRTPEYFAVLWRVQMTCSMMILREKRS